MKKLVTIYGGSGFVGRYVARRMAAEGWRVRVAVRRPNEALFVKPYGVVGQVEPVLCNIRDDASVARAMQGADAVVNCVGILSERGENTFESVHVDAAARVARIAAAQGIGQLVHLSAMGADEDAESDYLKSKAAGEAAVLAEMLSAMILRPSFIFGTEDEFFNRFAGMVRFSPFLPIVGGGNLYQPVWVDDVAHAAELGVTGAAPGGIYELGGPDVCSFRELMQIMLEECRRTRVIVNLPFWMARILAFSLDMVQAVSFGVIRNSLLTRDQVKSLSKSAVVSEDALGFADLGISPVPMALVLPDYLWRFRPSGQYEAIRESAENLHHQP